MIETLFLLPASSIVQTILGLPQICAADASSKSLSIDPTVVNLPLWQDIKSKIKMLTGFKLKIINCQIL